MLHQWCEAFGKRREASPGYLDAVATNLAGMNLSAFTLAAIEKSSRKIAGYIYCNLLKDCSEALVVGHPKVDTEYQRRGVGTMLLAAGQIHARQQGWHCSEASLAALAVVSSSHARLAKSVSHEVQWLQMAR